MAVRWLVACQPLPSRRGFADLKPSGFTHSYQKAVGDQGFVFFFFFNFLFYIQIVPPSVKLQSDLIAGF